MSAWKECRMKFRKVQFSELTPGQYVWHNIIGTHDQFIPGPFVVGDGAIINSSNVSIPISYFGPDIIWYVPDLGTAPASGA